MIALKQKAKWRVQSAQGAVWHFTKGVGSRGLIYWKNKIKLQIKRPFVLNYSGGFAGKKPVHTDSV